MDWSVIAARNMFSLGRRRRLVARSATLRENLQHFCLDSWGCSIQVLDLHWRPLDASDFGLSANGCFPLWSAPQIQLLETEQFQVARGHGMVQTAARG